ncbi:MAG TPA: MMPL family transporter [Thermoleophilaceae bacterium]|nr:MMPL family transporter [Thermoleophilaceae bacterium]
MSKGETFRRLVRSVARRPLQAMIVVAVLALGGAALALRLEPSAATDTLVSSSSDTFRATERFKKDFGDEAVVVLVKGNLQKTVLTEDLGRLISLEGCLSGNTPEEGLRKLPAGCRELSELKPARAVYGPGTFINTAAGQITDEFMRRRDATAGEAKRAGASARRASARRGDPPSEQRRLAASARSLVEGRFTREALQLALRYGITGLPSVDSPEFVSALVFDRRGGRVGVPKSRFSYLFPSKNAALVQVRLRPDLTDSERSRTIALIREVTRDQRLVPRRGARYVVTGVPVVVEGLAGAVREGILWLLGAAILVMAGTLALVFRTRLRLLPLTLALAAAAMTFGALSLAGGGLTMASIAALPVLIGLAVDYAIQFQARHEEIRRRGRAAPAETAAEAAAVGGPTIATAGLATAAGFLVLLLSPVPMVRGFGALMVLGTVIALACALTAGFASLVHLGGASRNRPADVPPPFSRLRGRARIALDALRASGPGRRISHRSRAARLGAIERAERALALSIERPRRVLAIGLAVAVVGWAADTQTEVVSDIRELVPQDLRALEDVEELQRETGVSGEIDVTVRADDITRPEVIGWLSRFQAGVLAEAGYKEGSSCTQAKDPPDLCPALSLPTILRTVDQRDQAEVNGLLDAVPAYFSQGVIRRDRKVANLAFGIRLQSLAEQKRVVDAITDRLDPPRGVTASVVGLPVLAAEANGQLSSPWRRALALLAALGAVFLVLLAFRRSRREAAVPLIPIALATGWSAGLLFLLGLLPEPLKVELNPMSVTLGALVIAISTEFSVLLSARYRQERDAGAPPARAMELTYGSTGAAVLASGATAIAGFAVLIASDIKMLRDFGILTVVDLGVSLLGVMVVLPAALVWAEAHGAFGPRDLDPRPFVRELADALRAARPRRRRPSLRALRPRAPRADA